MGLDDDDAQIPAWIFKAAGALVSLFGFLIVVFWLAFADQKPRTTKTAVVSDRATLVVFENETCVWCTRFRQNVAPAYERSHLEARAPLRYVHIREQSTSGYQLRGRVMATPTFVLVDRAGTEVDRIRGLPGGRDAFTTEVERLLAKLDTQNG